jgi:uncharacterized protein YbjT (DUF2867 family)
MSTTFDPQPTAVFGASGAQGGAVARALLGAGRPVRALSRTPGGVAALVAAGAEYARADLADPASLARALDGAGGAFVMVPFDAPPPVHGAYVAAALAALRAAGAPPAVFTTSGPVPTSATGAPSLDARRAAHEAVQRAVAESGLPVVTFVPGGYLGNLLGPWVAPAVVREGRIPYPLPAALRRPWISVEDQARLALAALGRPDLAGRSFVVGHGASGDDLAAAVSQALGRAVRWVGLDLDQFAASLVPVVGPHAAAALAEEYRLTAEHPAVAGAPLDYDAAPRTLGVALTPLAAWARAQDWAGAAAGAPRGEAPGHAGPADQ